MAIGSAELSISFFTPFAAPTEAANTNADFKVSKSPSSFSLLSRSLCSCGRLTLPFILAPPLSIHTLLATKGVKIIDLLDVWREVLDRVFSSESLCTGVSNTIRPLRVGGKNNHLLSEIWNHSSNLGSIVVI